MLMATRTRTTTFLNLESTAVSPATSLLELPSLGAHIWLGVAVRHARSLAKVPHCLTGILGAPQEDLQYVAHIARTLVHSQVKGSLKIMQDGVYFTMNNFDYLSKV